jgi:hypothetical protein
MQRQYNAFLIRHWALDDEQGERAELTHLQSGQRTRVASLMDALAWMCDLETRTMVTGEAAVRGPTAGYDEG